MNESSLPVCMRRVSQTSVFMQTRTNFQMKESKANRFLNIPPRLPCLLINHADLWAGA